jgi:hypothetical protein
MQNPPTGEKKLMLMESPINVGLTQNMTKVAVIPCGKRKVAREKLLVNQRCSAKPFPKGRRVSRPRGL